MPDCMMFPSDWRDFIKDYSFIDTEHIYTNGSELIQVLRVNQLIEHLLKEQEPIWNDVLNVWTCPSCGQMVSTNYCRDCGKKVKWE